MAKINIKFDVKGMKKLEEKLQGVVDEKTLGEIGEAIRIEMLSDISKGISPIKGRGRFAPYMAAADINQLKNQAKKLKSDSKKLTNYFSKNKLSAGASRLNKSADKIKNTSGRYPYNQQGRKWGKKPRPVNLSLSGAFLESLKVWFSGTGAKKTVNIGFKSGTGKTPGVKNGADAVTKELGHREAINQPPRPIIPIEGETLTPKYALLIRKILAQTLRIKFR